MQKENTFSMKSGKIILNGTEVNMVTNIETKCNAGQLLQVTLCFDVPIKSFEIETEPEKS